MNEGLKIEGIWDFIYHDLKGNQIKRITKRNLITQSGLNFLASLLINEHTNDITFYLALGTGTKPAELSDTQLQTEVFRKIIAAKTKQGSMVRLRFFFQSGEANGDWKEFSVYVAGTENKDSGVMLNRLVTPISKTSNTVLTLEVKILISGG